MAPKKKVRVEETSKLPDVAWQWCDGDDKTGMWRDFHEADAAILEKEFQANNTSVTTGAMSFSAGSKSNFDFTKWCQTNLSTNVVRRIRRLNVGIWEYIDDHGMYVALYDDDNVLVERLWRIMAPSGGQFVTKALSWNKGYDSTYTFTIAPDASGNPVGTQKNEDSGKSRSIRRVLPPLKASWETKGYGISGLTPPTATPAAGSGAAKTTTVESASVAAGDGALVAPPTTAPLSMAAVSSAVFAPPPTWVPQTQPYQQFDVVEGTKEYSDVVDPFLKTLKNKAKIHYVKRLQNELLWRFYALTRHRVALRNGGDPDERNLYHGARVRDNMNAIMEFGFDMRVARDGSAGVGIYFAVNASYSNAGYVLQNPDKSKEMLVCRVTVGSCVQGKHGLKRPPNKPGATNEYHDSVHNGKDIMYIVFDNCQAYPEYLIKYTNLTGW